MDKGIAVDASDLHSDQDNFLICLHSWWLVHQGQKRQPRPDVPGPADPCGLEASSRAVSSAGGSPSPGNGEYP